MKQRKEDQQKNSVRHPLETIIKIDRRGANYDINDEKYIKKIKVRCQFQTLNLQLQEKEAQSFNMSDFWKHVGQFHIKKIDDHEKDRVNYIKQYVQYKTKSLKYFFHNYIQYQVYQKLVNEDVLFSKFGSQQKQNQINLKLHLFLSYTQQKNNKQRIKLIPKLKKNTIENQLQEEQEKLQQQIQSNYKDKWVDQQIKLLLKQLEKLTQSNYKQIIQLEEKIEQEENINNIIYIENKNSKKVKKNNLHRFYNQQYYQEEIRQYLAKLIIQLEDKQVADSIVFIEKIQKEKGFGSNYVCYYDKVLNNELVTFSEEEINRLNKVRDQSLFSVYTCGQKSSYSYICHNFFGFSLMLQQNKKNLLPKEDLQEQMKQKQQITNGKFRPQFFQQCHQCLQLMPVEQMLKCNYKSSCRGLPQVNPMAESNIILSQIDEYIHKDTRNTQSRKKNNSYLQYECTNGELICNRHYCRNCVKFYDYKLLGQFNLDWTCFFCQGVCNCPRCIRYETILRYKQLYMRVSGNFELIENKSLLCKYQKIEQEEMLKKEKKSVLINRSKPLKQKNQSYNNKIRQLKQDEQTQQVINYNEQASIKKIYQDVEFMQNKRIELENMREVLCQVKQREKIKYKMTLESVSEKLMKVQKNGENRQNPLRQITQEVEDFVPFNDQLSKVKIQIEDKPGQKKRKLLKKELYKIM